uniref:Uncharacterized protein n=1 Tax=Parascaris univalens TaxID=6257 RepID=A0A914ZXV4_PARUN
MHHSERSSTDHLKHLFILTSNSTRRSNTQHEFTYSHVHLVKKQQERNTLSKRTESL